FDDGTAEMKLTVQKTTIQPEKIDNDKKTTPKTGDPNHPGLWIALLALAAAGIAVMGATILRRRKKQ
ncbi:MAG: hypothetical protein IJL72_03980, partial [Lachnospiraceae bacterium]|nr:hypothetical protein [Lachnospiraceae bacterium]